MFKKVSSVELACFEDPDFYDKYVKAISEATGRTQQVLGSLGDIVYFIFNAFATSFIIFTIDPVLIVFALIHFIVSILFGKRLNKVRYNYNMEMQEKSRKRDNVKRVFYLADYAKEMRLTNINRVMFKKFYESIKELNRAVSGMKDAGIYDKVMSLENGCETVLTKVFDENGAVLSGGEAQKVAISRVFAKDCEIVILDEPSSALDPMTEYELNNTLLTALDKTVIIISHRLSTTRMADVIYMLENGEIIEKGSHDELMRLNGKYAEMFLKQAEKYNK